MVVHVQVWAWSGKSDRRIELRLRPDSDRECRRDDPYAAEKAGEVRAARTPNRLRWLGREYQGDRVNRG